ncbi:MAG: dihydroorotase [Acidaminococcaceae bacterium]|nr:dihydroorotase [Acidaminococcaceae bacterium]
MKILIKNGRVVDPSQKLDKVCDVLVKDGKIARIAKNIQTKADEVFDATGLVVVPGLVDVHTHLREPGYEAKETIKTGTMAAAAGGITTVACMPNTLPVCDNSIVVSGIKERALKDGFAHVEVVGAISKNLAGKELAELADMAEKGAMGFSDDGHYVQSSRLMTLAAKYVTAFDKPLICHAIDQELDADGYMHEGIVSAKNGVPGVPPLAEDIAVARDVLIAEYTGAHIHIAHCASKGALDIIRQAKRRGVNVSCEVTVHHLTLTDEACANYDTATKISPPLRSWEHVEACRQAVLDGTASAIVTDHSPHCTEEKDVEFRLAPNGFPGLETSLGVILTDLYHTDIFDLNTIISKMSCEPAKLFGLHCGTLKVGSVADITIINLNKEWQVQTDKFYSKCHLSPYAGKQCKGKAVATILAGKFVMKEGKVQNYAKA